MTFLADENFPRPAVEALRQAGFDVLWIAEANPGAPDDEVLALCISTGRVLLTFDKDFGELAYRRSRSAPCGIVLFRVTPQSPDEIASIALSAMQSQQSGSGFECGLFPLTAWMNRIPRFSTLAARS
jgi:predicted nuclease of predicted toxin-antitoxin system